MAIAAGNGEEAARLKKRASELGASISARAQATEAAGLELGLEALRRRFQLDGEDADLLLHAGGGRARSAGSASCTPRLAGVPFHPWLDVGLAIPGAPRRRRASRCGRGGDFCPARRSCTSGCCCSIARAPRARENLLACDVRTLPPRVARLLAWAGPPGAGRHRRTPASSKPDIHARSGDPARSYPRRDRRAFGRAARTSGARLADWGHGRRVPRRAWRGGSVDGGPARHREVDAGARAGANGSGNRLLVVDVGRLLEAGRGDRG